MPGHWPLATLHPAFRRNIAEQVEPNDSQLGAMSTQPAITDPATSRHPPTATLESEPVPERSQHPHYELLERCGQGGMGVVYKARDKRLNRIVALKFLAPDHIGDPDSRRRFQREAEAIAALNHPNIAVLYEIGEWDAEPFLALEFLPGGTIKQVLKLRSLGLSEILSYAYQLGSGLDFAHDKGILHRDIKPSNGMFATHGELKLVDFGLAKWGSSAEITRTGGTIGTTAYMAPELILGEDATQQSDLYSFGVLVYELAARRPMFRGERPESVVHQILYGTPVPLETVRPDLPPDLGAVILRAAARDRRDRYASVADFLEDLERVAPTASKSGIVPPVYTLRTRTLSTGTPFTTPRRRRIRYAVIAALAVAAIAVAFFLPVRRWIAPIAGTSQAKTETVVVLPFDNLSGNPTLAPFCAGLQETVTSMLSHAEALRRNVLVIPSAEVRRTQVNSIAGARKLFNAGLALTGSIQPVGDELQLTINLTDARTLTQKDSRILMIKPSETVDLQSRLADEVGSLLGSGPINDVHASLPGQTTRSSEAYRLFVEGQGALLMRRVDAAIATLEKALKADPDYSAARAKLAEAYLLKYNSTDDRAWLARADLEVNRAASAGPISEVVYVQAMIRLETGDTAKAIDQCRQLLAGDPGNVEAQSLLADALSDAGQPAEAEAAYQRAIRLRPGYWPTYMALGVFYLHQQQYAKAEQALTTAETIAPGVPSIYYNLGAVYFNQSRWKDAETQFRQSIELQPNALAYSNLGTVLFFQRNYPESARQFEQATRLQPANPVNWGNLGDALWQIDGDRAKAREAFEKASVLASQQLGINPSDAGLRKSYALYLAKLGRTHDSEQEIQRAISTAPKDAGVHFYAARVYAVLGDNAKAQAALSESLALGYNSKEADREPDLAAVRQKTP